MDEKCPFCEGTMVQVEKIDLKEGIFITMECSGCGFRATFRKPAPTP